jgi:hypothetical protein
MDSEIARCNFAAVEALGETSAKSQLEAVRREGLIVLSAAAARSERRREDRTCFGLMGDAAECPARRETAPVRFMWNN